MNLLNSGIEPFEIGISTMSADSGFELPHSRIACALAHNMVGQESLSQIDYREIFEAWGTKHLKNVNLIGLLLRCMLSN